jgi:hypothetical protein
LLFLFLSFSFLLFLFLSLLFYLYFPYFPLDALFVLNKKYFGGGTVSVALSNENFVKFRDTEESHRKYEDGTLDFLNIISVKFGIQQLNRIGLTNIKIYTTYLINYWYNELNSLCHYNGMWLNFIISNLIEFYYFEFDLFSILLLLQVTIKFFKYKLFYEI